MREHLNDVQLGVRCPLRCSGSERTLFLEQLQIDTLAKKLGRCQGSRKSRHTTQMESVLRIACTGSSCSHEKRILKQNGTQEWLSWKTFLSFRLLHEHSKWTLQTEVLWKGFCADMCQVLVKEIHVLWDKMHLECDELSHVFQSLEQRQSRETAWGTYQSQLPRGWCFLEGWKRCYCSVCTDCLSVCTLQRPSRNFSTRPNCPPRCACCQVIPATSDHFKCEIGNPFQHAPTGTRFWLAQNVSLMMKFPNIFDAEGKQFCCLFQIRLL